MKRLQCLLLAPALLVLLASTSFAGDMHSDLKISSPNPTVTHPAVALEIPEPGTAEVGYLELIVDTLGTLLSAIY